MTIPRRHFIKKMGLGLAAAGLAAQRLTGSADVSKGQSEKLLMDNPDQPEPAPKGCDRLPLDWYKNTVDRLKNRSAEKGVDGILLESDHNKVYFTGCFRGSGDPEIQGGWGSHVL